MWAGASHIGTAQVCDGWLSAISYQFGPGERKVSFTCWLYNRMKFYGLLSMSCVIALTCSQPAKADCVVGASMAQSFRVIDSSTIILDGPSRILVKTYCYCFLRV